MALYSIDKYLPSSLTSEITDKPNLKGIRKALSESDDALAETIEAARKELFINTADGRYLVNLASQYGFVVPRWAGLDTSGIRTLAIPAIFLPKQSKNTFKKIVEAFYSKEILQPSFMAALPGPYSLADGDDLVIKTESDSVTVTFRTSQVSNLGSVTAGEVAGIINSQQSLVIADTVIDKVTNTDRLRLTSYSYGVEASVRIAGGTAQNILRFPDAKNVFGDTGTVWEISKYGNYSHSDVVRFRNVGGYQPALWDVEIGDVLTIRGFKDSDYDVGAVSYRDAFSLLNGSYVVSDVGMETETTGYFVIKNLSYCRQQKVDGVFEASASTPIKQYIQGNPTELVFTANTPLSIYRNKEYAIISEPAPSLVQIEIPPVPPITRQSIRGSSHLRGRQMEIISFNRNQLVISSKIAVPNSGRVVIATAQSFDRANTFHVLNYVSSVSMNGETTLFLSEDTLMPITDPADGALSYNPIYAEVDGGEFVVTVPNGHGFVAGQEIILAGVDFSLPGGGIVTDVSGDVDLANINRKHVVYKVLSSKTFSLLLQDYAGTGNPVKYSGIRMGGITVRMRTTEAGKPLNSAQHDVIFEFASEADAINSGLTVGKAARIESVGIMIANPSVWELIKSRKMTVISRAGNEVYLRSGRAIFDGLLGYGCVVRRSGSFGGPSASCAYNSSIALDSWNINNWAKDLRLILLDAETPNFDPSINPDYLGPYIYDVIGTKQPYVVSSIATKFDNSGSSPFVIRKNSAPGEILVDSITDFPATGLIVINHGTDSVEGPIYYTGVAGSGPYRIFIDPSYVFKNTHEESTSVRLIRDNAPMSVSTDGSDYPMYITDVMSARYLVEKILGDVSASGIKIEIDVKKPTLFFSEESIDPFEPIVS